MNEYLVVLMTAATKAEAESIAHELVSRNLAACVNIVPNITSIFRWKGELCKESEVFLVAKTDRQRYPDLEHAVRYGHSYEIPEIIALSVVTGSESYLAWLGESLGEPRVEE